jgi:hypothetical protein
VFKTEWKLEKESEIWAPHVVSERNQCVRNLQSYLLICRKIYSISPQTSRAEGTFTLSDRLTGLLVTLLTLIGIYFLSGTGLLIIQKFIENFVYLLSLSIIRLILDIEFVR